MSVELWPVREESRELWPGEAEAIELMRALLAVVARHYGPDSSILAEMVQTYEADGWGVPVIMACDALIIDHVPVPVEVLALYARVGKSLMEDDPEFMADYYDDLVKLAA